MRPLLSVKDDKMADPKQVTKQSLSTRKADEKDFHSDNSFTMETYNTGRSKFWADIPHHTFMPAVLKPRRRKRQECGISCATSSTSTRLKRCKKKKKKGKKKKTSVGFLVNTPLWFFHVLNFNFLQSHL